MVRMDIVHGDLRPPRVRRERDEERLLAVLVDDGHGVVRQHAVVGVGVGDALRHVDTRTPGAVGVNSQRCARAHVARVN